MIYPCKLVLWALAFVTVSSGHAIITEFLNIILTHELRGWNCEQCLQLCHLCPYYLWWLLLVFRFALKDSYLHIEWRACWIYYFFLVRWSWINLWHLWCTNFAQWWLKSSILTECNHSVYNISRMSFPIMDPTIDPSDLQYMSNRQRLTVQRHDFLSKSLDKIKTQRFEDYFILFRLYKTFNNKI